MPGHPQTDFEFFAARWLVRIVAVFLRAVRGAGTVRGAALAESLLDLPPAACDAADTLARTAPSPHVLRELSLSGLVKAQSIPDNERDRHGH